LNSKITACDGEKVNVYVASRIKKTIGKPNKWRAWDYRDSNNEPLDAIGEAILNATADQASIDMEIVITAKGEELAVRPASGPRLYSNISINNYQPDNQHVSHVNFQASGSFSPYTAALGSQLSNNNWGTTFTATTITKTFGTPNSTWQASDYLDGNNNPPGAVGDSIVIATADGTPQDLQIHVI
jgi:hypothetical protein